jgi:hypothetical protein
MILHGLIKLGNENLSFALPVFKDKDNYLHIQDSSNKQGTIERFIKLGDLENINKEVFEKLDNPIEKNIGDSILYIFKTHNSIILIGSKHELIDSLDDCYRQVFFSVFELMNFLGKQKESNRIKRYLFSEYMNIKRNKIASQNLVNGRVKKSLGKQKESNRIKKYLFSEYMNTKRNKIASQNLVNGRVEKAIEYRLQMVS